MNSVEEQNPLNNIQISRHDDERVITDNMKSSNETLANCLISSHSIIDNTVDRVGDTKSTQNTTIVNELKNVTEPPMEYPRKVAYPKALSPSQQLSQIKTRPNYINLYPPPIITPLPSPFIITSYETKKGEEVNSLEYASSITVWSSLSSSKLTSAQHSVTARPNSLNFSKTLFKSDI